MFWNVQHRHVDKNAKKWVGKEYRPWPQKPVDGYFTIGDDEFLLEFLGDNWHGHPHFWLNNEQKMLTRVKKHNPDYTVLYVWECDYRTSKKTNYRTFENKLEFE
jgi:hypothetical protein